MSGLQSVETHLVDGFGDAVTGGIGREDRPRAGAARLVVVV
jgi:hypothetical protein